MSSGVGGAQQVRVAGDGALVLGGGASSGRRDGIGLAGGRRRLLGALLLQRLSAQQLVEESHVFSLASAVRRRRTHHTYPNERVVRAFRRSVASWPRSAGEWQTAGMIFDTLVSVPPGSAEPGTADRGGTRSCAVTAPVRRERRVGDMHRRGRCSWRSCRRRVWWWRCSCPPARRPRWARSSATCPGSRPWRSPPTTRSSTTTAPARRRTSTSCSGTSRWLSLANPNAANYADLVGGPTTAGRCSACPTAADSAGLLDPHAALRLGAAGRTAGAGAAVHGLLPQRVG